MSVDPAEGKEFLGAGVAFPLGVDSQGRIAMRSLEDQVRQSILLILRTARGERVMRPDFGAGLEQHAFAPLIGTTIALAEHQSKEALVRFEPRIEVLSLVGRIHPTEEGALLLELQYRVRRTDTTFNLVYPFYVERGER
jgi:phage baseplate assembly protein W